MLEAMYDRRGEKGRMTVAPDAEPGRRARATPNGSVPTSRPSSPPWHVPVRRIVALTVGLRAPGVEHASFRLELADGRVLKGRRLPSAEHAARVTVILDAMADAPTSRP